VNPTALRMARYIVVGAGAVAVNLVLFALFVGVLGWGYLQATVVVFLLVNGAAFVLNRGWVFQHRGAIAPSAARYYAIMAISLGLNLLLMRALVGTVGFNYLLASLVVSLLLGVANFAAHQRITFGSRGSP
jgi:putative flippase GtrA